MLLLLAYIVDGEMLIHNNQVYLRYAWFDLL